MKADEWLALAGWLGAHALSVFWALLCALLLLVASAGWLWRVHVLPRARAAASAPVEVLLRLAVGFAIVVAGAAGFAAVAERLGAGGTLSLVDQALTTSLRAHVGTRTLQAFALLTHFGDPSVLAVLGVAVAAWLLSRGERTLALGWVLALAGNALLNPMLKRIFERVRPVHEPGAIGETGWSFPSGHTSGATVAYGMLAYVVLRTLPPRWQLPGVLCAAGLAYTVGSSRVFLGVHFVSDVVAGFASGTAWLMACIVSVGLTERWRAHRAR